MTAVFDTVDTHAALVAADHRLDGAGDGWVAIAELATPPSMTAGADADGRLAAVEGLDTGDLQPAAVFDAAGAQAAYRWLVNPKPTTWPTPLHDQTVRDRATVLALHAGNATIGSGLQVFKLYKALDAATARPDRAMAVRAAAATFASQYLSTVEAEQAQRRTSAAAKPAWYAIVGGELVEASTIGLGRRIDGICRVVEDRWDIDVLSVAKRAGQLASDCAAGRVQRCVRLATHVGLGEADTVMVRLFAPAMDRPKIVFEAITGAEMERRFAELSAAFDNTPGGTSAPRRTAVAPADVQEIAS